MTKNLVAVRVAALIALECSGAQLGGCSSTSCADSDSCGSYQPPDVCDGAACFDGTHIDVPDATLAPDVDAALDTNRDISVDGPSDNAGDVFRRDVDAQDIADGADATDDAVPRDAADSGRDAAGDTDAGAGADANADADADAGPTCDATKSPIDDACVVDDRFGVFVSPIGNDATGLGTKVSPYASVTKGLSVAQGKNVYVCAGTYAESVTVEGALDGARVFGGFDCLSWAYAAAKRPVIKPTSGPALVVKALSKGLRIEDVEFDAPATMTSGESSVAAWMTGSANVKLVRVKLVASAAQAGADGTAATNYDPALQQSDAKIAGHNAAGAMGGATQTCANLCTNGEHATGGKGGKGAPGAASDAGADASAPTAGADGAPSMAMPDPAPNNGAGGDPQVAAVACTNGTTGSNAPTMAGGAGATQPGMFTSMGWSRTDGASGTSGGPAQGGGGGGGGQSATTGGGGGGGCGGCGGAAGPGGQSGGSSFALLSSQSIVTLDACTLVAGAGGNGGNGADGQAGQLGGAGGAQTTFGCPGGAGGQGGQAGGGGGGAGGHSIAIGYAGTPPTQMNGTTMAFSAQAATAGAAGSGGSPSAATGAAGKSVGAMALP